MHVQKHMHGNFPKTLAYNRSVELQLKELMPTAVVSATCCLGKCNGVSFIDSTLIRVCHIKREFQHLTLKGLTTKGQCLIGWLLGFKLYIRINEKAEILDFLFPKDNVYDRYPHKNKNFHYKISGKIFADKRYISQTLFYELFFDRIHLLRFVNHEERTDAASE